MDKFGDMMKSPDLELELEQLLKKSEGPRLLRMMRQSKLMLIISTSYTFVQEQDQTWSILLQLGIGICQSGMLNRPEHREGIEIQKEPQDWSTLDQKVATLIKEKSAIISPLIAIKPKVASVADIWLSDKVKTFEDADALKGIVRNRLLKLDIMVKDFGFASCKHSLEMLGVLKEQK